MCEVVATQTNWAWSICNIWWSDGSETREVFRVYIREWTYNSAYRSPVAGHEFISGTPALGSHVIRTRLHSCNSNWRACQVRSLRAFKSHRFHRKDRSFTQFHSKELLSNLRDLEYSSCIRQSEVPLGHCFFVPIFNSFYNNLCFLSHVTFRQAFYS